MCHFIADIKDTTLYIILRKKCPYSEFSGLHFHAFGVNTDIYSANLFILSKFGNLRTRYDCEYGHFSGSVVSLLFFLNITFNSV